MEAGAAASASGASARSRSRARARFARPLPRVAEAKWLRERGARAMIDLSDGLAADATHLAAASGVRCTIEVERVPVHPGAGWALQALAGGEEYELLLALPGAQPESLSHEFRERFGIPLTRVGKVDAGEGVRVIRAGATMATPNLFKHF